MQRAILTSLAPGRAHSIINEGVGHVRIFPFPTSMSKMDEADLYDFQVHVIERPVPSLHAAAAKANVLSRTACGRCPLLKGRVCPAKSGPLRRVARHQVIRRFPSRQALEIRHPTVDLWPLLAIETKRLRVE